MPQYLGAFKSRKSIAAFLREGEGLVAGQLVRTDEGPRLRDSTGELPLPEDVWAGAPCWLAVRLQADGRYQVVYRQDLERDPVLDQQPTRHARLRARMLIRQAVRSFFLERGFLEADTPVAVPNPGSEPYLDTFPVGSGWLRTSPELHMKQLLGMGFDRIFQMGPCFRKGDLGRWHREEFTMLEWYRCFADLDHIAQDITELLARLAPHAVDPAYFERAPERVTCAALFERELGLVLTDNESREPLRAALLERGIQSEPEDDWDTLYFLLFLNFIEPGLGRDRPVLVSHYPASQAALAKRVPVERGVFPSCYRMELYLGGLEAANGFYELTDGAEQRVRFEGEARRRAALGKVVYPLDETFLGTLERGLPPTAGIALGVDRLVAALLGSEGLDELLPFPPYELGAS